MTATSSSYNTYEATKAAATASSLADPIHWRHGAAFRDANYRQLHHQNGIAGIFSVRLVEASDLQRSYWSVLALGPVARLGLSKAHGEVSSFCSFQLSFAGIHEEDELLRRTRKPPPLDSKPAAHESKTKPSIVSPVVPQDNNPVWDSCQFEFPLQKGACKDGERIYLDVKVEEESAMADNVLPTGGGSRMLGTGQVDLTPLCLGESESGQTCPGVLDAWVEISLKGHDRIIPLDSKDPLALPTKEEESKSTGKVRVLVSYQPYGLEPQVKDVIAFESFARQHPHSTCSAAMDPLAPLVVLERRGSYILAEYWIENTQKACLRIHRNAVFVIERQNWLDAAHNLALLPLDVVVRTPVGRGVAKATGPVVAATTELLMPALLSVKLVWMAARTTGLGIVSGVSALGGTVWQEGTGSLTGSRHANHHHHQGRPRKPKGTAQFVQL